MKLTSLLLVGLIGCASVGKSNYTTKEYRGSNNEYNISATESFSGDRCIEREITLRESNSLHIHLTNGHVSYVKATDRRCDEVFDRYYFRYPKDRGVNKFLLSQDLNNLFYWVKYKWE